MKVHWLRLTVEFSSGWNNEECVVFMCHQTCLGEQWECNGVMPRPWRDGWMWFQLKKSLFLFISFSPHSFWMGSMPLSREVSASARRQSDLQSCDFLERQRGRMGGGREELKVLHEFRVFHSSTNSRVLSETLTASSRSELCTFWLFFCCGLWVLLL